MLRGLETEPEEGSTAAAQERQTSGEARLALGLY